MDAKTYSRDGFKFRGGIKQQAWDAATNPLNGRVYDPLTNIRMGPSQSWVMGHKPGMEYWKERDIAINQWLYDRTFTTRGQFLDILNDPSRYRPELKTSNSSHLGEDPTNLFWK